MNSSKRIAECGMMAALCVVIMLVGAWLGIGLYASPMFAGLFLIPPGRKYGRKYHLTLWLAVSVISLILVPEIEQNLMFLCFFGCYPLLYPYFYRLRPPLRTLCKFLFFNIVIIAVESLIMFVIAPEVTNIAMLAVFLLLFNLTFVCFDFIIPRFELLLNRYIGKLRHK